MSGVIQELAVLSGKDKRGNKEGFESITFLPGHTVSVVGPTGSGKSAFINDIEMLAQRDTVTGREVLINGERPVLSYREDPAKKPVALITQHTRYLADMCLEEFLSLHIQARKSVLSGGVERTIDLANTLTGEGVSPKMRMTELSGGQSRALMIADAIIIGNAPIVLLDEVENAGVFKEKVLKIVKSEGKIIVFVTHDPRIALLSDTRIVMKNGAVVNVLKVSEEERKAQEKVLEHDIMLNMIRERIRNGEIIHI